MNLLLKSSFHANFYSNLGKILNLLLKWTEMSLHLETVNRHHGGRSRWSKMINLTEEIVNSHSHFQKFHINVGALQSQPSTFTINFNYNLWLIVIALFFFGLCLLLTYVAISKQKYYT